MEISQLGEHPKLSFKNHQAHSLVLVQPSGQCWTSGGREGVRRSHCSLISLIRVLREGLL